MFDKVFKIITFVPRKVITYAKSINTALMAPLELKEKMSAFEVACTKMFGTTSAGILFGKGAADAAEAIACDDKVCFVVSCIGCGFDTLGFVTNFVPGPNVTQIITIPGSMCCKVFVKSCKLKTLPWKGGCK